MAEAETKRGQGIVAALHTSPEINLRRDFMASRQKTVLDLIMCA
jgi:hypothetical protein